MSFTRRHFLTGTAAGVVSGFIGQQSPFFTEAHAATSVQLAGGAGVLVVPSSQSRRSILGKNYSASESDLCVYDIDRDEQFLINVPVGLGHSVCAHPQKKHCGLIVEIFGDYAAEFDVKKRKAIRQLRAEKGRVFSGHGLYSPDGRLLFTPEYVPRQPDQCALVIRDAESGNKISELATHGVRPHEVLWLQDDLVAVSHYGYYPKVKPSDLQSAVSFLNIKSGELIKRVTPEDKNVAMCHMYLANDGKVYVLTLNALEREGDQWQPQREIRMSPPRLREIGYRNGLTGDEMSSFLMITGIKEPDRTVKLKEFPSGFTGSLSVAHHPGTNTLGITHVSDKLITFWNPEKVILKSKLSLATYPSGLALTSDQKNFVTIDDVGQVFLIDCKTLNITKRASLGMAAASGSAHIHLFPPI